MNLKSFPEGGIPRKAEMTRFEMIRIPDAVILIRYDSVRSYSKELFRNNLYRLNPAHSGLCKGFSTGAVGRKDKQDVQVIFEQFLRYCNGITPPCAVWRCYSFKVPEVPSVPPDKTGGMESYMILDVFLDALMDCLKDLPFLFAAFLLLEFLEQHVSDKMNRTLADTADGLGPLAGSLLGCVPQCGFSIMAAELYAGRVITLGALMAVFLSTSDEALIILLSNPGHVKEVATLIATKIIIGIIAGYAVLGVETVYRRKKKLPGRDISDLDEIFGGHEEEGILKPALLHTAEVALFLFICTFVLNLLMELIGMQTVSKILLRAI